MPAITFPSSPSDADQYTFNGVTYEYEAAANKWKVVDNGAGSVDELTEAQATDPNSTAFGTVSGERLGQHTDDAFNVSGAAPKYACRAWAKFSGTSNSVNASGNVSSITDLGAGLYRINFATAMPDTDYSVSLCYIGTDDNQNTFRVVSQLTTSVKVQSGAYQSGAGNDDRDVATGFVQIFR